MVGKGGFPRKPAKHLVNTQLCSFHVLGQCTRGLACKFAHDVAQLVPQPDFYKSRLCAQFLKNGECNFGSECRHAHDERELRNIENTAALDQVPARQISGGTAALDQVPASFSRQISGGTAFSRQISKLFSGVTGTTECSGREESELDTPDEERSCAENEAHCVMDAVDTTETEDLVITLKNSFLHFAPVLSIHGALRRSHSMPGRLGSSCQ
ncbi:unnamed protein product [Polarella glacialis]|uniref:C3H1-type domain-containing protein n=1 Tax=Polarella glacialis TaxID=89957 RepID=A0A813HNV8_POLGL|nr:unnamed protein product [Polarella glacialis]CAE8740516.1 unnamed protein product [Polarella glacialis]